MRAPFDAVVADHGGVVLRVCRAILGPEDAQEAWSETFLSALRAYPDLRDDSNLRGWLVTIAHRRSIDQVRANQRRATPVELPEDMLAAPPEDRSDPIDSRLADAVRSLPDKQRLAVVLRYLADQSYADIARSLGSSPDAARRSAADGIAALRAWLPLATPDPEELP